MIVSAAVLLKMYCLLNYWFYNCLITINDLSIHVKTIYRDVDVTRESITLENAM